MEIVAFSLCFIFIYEVFSFNIELKSNQHFKNVFFRGNPLDTDVPCTLKLRFHHNGFFKNDLSEWITWQKKSKLSLF